MLWRSTTWSRPPSASVLPTETEHEWELVRVAVHPEARGQGFGLATVRAAFEAATSKGATSVRWCSDPFQTAAHAIYERFASSEVDEHGRRHYRIEI